jgi:outer membrane protein OmpA-like peptidoglycan-associated protein
VTYWKGLTVAAVTLAVSACGFADRNGIANMPVKGGEWNQALHAGYVKLADMESAEADWADWEYFLEMKALPAAMGEMVQPDAIASRDLPADKVALLTAARDRLFTVINNGGAQRAPKETADAQVGFDCWMQEQEENFQPKDIEWCQKMYIAAIEAAEAKLKPAAMAPKPMMAPKVDGRSSGYFGFNSVALSNEAVASIVRAADDFKAAKPAAIAVQGHADRSGATAYNEKLAERRVNAVSAALIRMGVPATAIAEASFGETEPAVPTPDGAKEEYNRRVIIEFKK